MDGASRVHGFLHEGVEKWEKGTGFGEEQWSVSRAVQITSHCVFISMLAFIVHMLLLRGGEGRKLGNYSI